MNGAGQGDRDVIPLAFQPGTPGSAEHYFHFLLGYVLPAIGTIRRGRIHATKPPRYLLRSCGPVMDVVLDEIFQAFGLSFDIAVKTDPRFEAVDAVRVPRWDLSIFLGPDGHRMPSRGSSRCDTLHRLSEVRDQVVDLALASHDTADLYADKVLLLKRSVEPDFYRTGGSAEIARYGIGRRSLSGQDWAKAKLDAAGLPAEIYEPGAHGFFDQVRAFNACRGVVAIRGAEVANMLWMRPEAFCVVLNANDTPIRHLHYLGDLGGLRLEVLDRRAEGPHLQLQARDLAAISQAVAA